jgi:hypothetical protein
MKKQLKKWAEKLLKEIKELPRYAPEKFLSYREVKTLIELLGEK